MFRLGPGWSWTSTIHRPSWRCRISPPFPRPTRHRTSTSLPSPSVSVLDVRPWIPLDASTPGKNERCETRASQHAPARSQKRNERRNNDQHDDAIVIVVRCGFKPHACKRMRHVPCDTHAPLHTFRDVHIRRVRRTSRANAHDANVAVHRRTCACIRTSVLADVHASANVEGRHATHVRRASLVVHACVACRRRGRKARHDAKETHVRVRRRWRRHHRRRRTKTSAVVRDWRGSRTKKNRIGGESWWICTTTTWRGA